MLRLDPALLRSKPATAAALALAGLTTGTILAALVFQHVLGYQPCELCYQQRIPYYAAIAASAIASVLALRNGETTALRIILALIAIVMLVSAGLGTYHSGAEWGFWAGPNSCGTVPFSGFPTGADAFSQLRSTRVVSCTAVQWRFLGLSFAGWNVVISLTCAAVALWGMRAKAPYGSSSASQ